ncbi:MAG: preprotein translocase subunit SecA [Acidobacteriota bacterium]|jgi:preprotein translocase subunit SecA|nr:preprotein translocase subunit SecA [Acidobacteriota bacterium]
MINNVLSKVFGTHNDRELKRISEAFLGPINSLEPSMEKLSDSDLSRKTEEFKDRLANSETLDDILVDAFAVAREAGRRVLNMRHYDVQLIGGVVLHEGKIAEMATGEGKTLVATLPAYLNALAGGGVHIITVNDYLARRDSEWMGPLYELLGLTIGNIQHDMPDDDRRAAYGADITFGTNNEFGFDYLRDNMKFQSEDMVQPTHNFAIVDEVDSILIDESRTPLIISGPAEQSTELYYKVDRLIPALKLERDYEVDEKNRSAALTEEGVSHLERLLGVDNLYDASHMDLVHHCQQAVKAHALFKRDRDYLLKDGEVVIVDEFTGRMMPGRRWSDGLHQAVEAKEGVKIAQENQTLATITFQNFFRMYDKLAGMTGTAITEAPEFHKIYDLDVLEIPTNKPLIRDELPDVIFRTESEKWKAAVEEITEQNETGRPVLVGTTSIEKSEKISKMLGKRGVKHVVLNAKHHEREAEIVALAGQQGAVTIATNMAGRGTDIVLGDGVKELGGLHVLGTERHEARRIDNQLRGRTGRQGDAGSSQFILSLEDDLMRIFGMDRLQGLMARLGMEENVPIEDRMVTKALERAQRQVEGRNFETRKHLLEYDDVMEKQRQAIYAMRHDQMSDETAPRRFVLETAEDILDWLLDTHFDPEADPLDWETDEMRTQLKHFFGLGREDFTVDLDQDSIQDIRTELMETIRDHYQTKVDRIGEVITQFETWICLQVIDARWKEHLYALDRLKEGIGLRGYGQRNPLVEYKRESFEMYQEVHERICGEVVRYAFQLEPMSQEERQAQLAQQQAEAKRVQRVAAAAGGSSSPTETVVRQNKKVGRNSPCPCGSGRKYKKCCGR